MLDKDSTVTLEALDLDRNLSISSKILLLKFMVSWETELELRAIHDSPVLMNAVATKLWWFIFGSVLDSSLTSNTGLLGKLQQSCESWDRVVSNSNWLFDSFNEFVNFSTFCCKLCAISLYRVNSAFAFCQASFSWFIWCIVNWSEVADCMSSNWSMSLSWWCDFRWIFVWHCSKRGKIDGCFLKIVTV